MGPKRSYAANAGNGKVRVSSAKAVAAKTEYSRSAKNASLNMPASVTSGSEKLGESISDLKIVTGSLMGSRRNSVASAIDGKTRLHSTRIGRQRMA